MKELLLENELDVVFGGRRGRGNSGGKDKKDKDKDKNKSSDSNSKSENPAEKAEKNWGRAEIVRDVIDKYERFKEKTGYEPPHMKENWQP